MSIPAQILTQAREALAASDARRRTLVAQLREQSQKISDLELEVQRQAMALTRSREDLASARTEIDNLRAQLPDAETKQAFGSLANYLATPSEPEAELSIAA